MGQRRESGTEKRQRRERGLERLMRFGVALGARLASAAASREGTRRQKFPTAMGQSNVAAGQAIRAPHKRLRRATSAAASKCTQASCTPSGCKVVQSRQPGVFADFDPRLISANPSGWNANARCTSLKLSRKMEASDSRRSLVGFPHLTHLTHLT